MMAKLWRIWKGAVKLVLSDELAYRFNFILTSIAHIIFSAVGPLVALLIYTTSSGIPGWSFEEFLLLTGTFTLVVSINYVFLAGITWETIEKIWQGRYDADLIRPVRPLSLATATAFDMDNLSSVVLGAIIVIFALLKLNWAFSIINLASYLLLLGLAILFFYSLDIIVTSLAFVVTRSGVLMNILDEIIGIGKNPITIFGATGMILFTFIFPIGLAAFYPASALLGRLSTVAIIELAIIAFAFFGFSLLLWSIAIKKYTSAGG
jgi:ABC-2 type transport system permease protein